MLHEPGRALEMPRPFSDPFFLGLHGEKRGKNMKKTTQTMKTLPGKGLKSWGWVRTFLSFFSFLQGFLHLFGTWAMNRFFLKGISFEFHLCDLLERSWSVFPFWFVGSGDGRWPLPHRR